MGRLGKKVRRLKAEEFQKAVGPKRKGGEAGPKQRENHPPM